MALPFGRAAAGALRGSGGVAELLAALGMRRGARAGAFKAARKGLRTRSGGRAPRQAGAYGNTPVMRGLFGAVETKKKGMMARLLSEYARKTAKNPISYGIPATALGVDLGRFGYEEVLEPVGSAVAGGLLSGERLREAGISADAGMAGVAAVRERSRMARQSIRENIKVIAQSNPQLYNELVAGKRLPRGAVVLGGPPRRDLLEEVATMMAGVQ